MMPSQFSETLISSFNQFLILAEESSSQEATKAALGLDLQQMLKSGGPIGYIIIILSVVMIALIGQHLLTLRRTSLIPSGLAEEVHRLLGAGQLDQANEICKQNPSFLSYVLRAGLSETDLGYREVEKGMEEASAEQAARLFRKTEYLNIIGTIAPMLGLLGTVWGMIQAFVPFALKANPSVAELAPGISRALVTTLMGLAVAIPALTSFSLLRNRIDELVAEASLIAEHVFSGYKRRSMKSKVVRQKPESKPTQPPS